MYLAFHYCHLTITSLSVLHQWSVTNAESLCSYIYCNNILIIVLQPKAPRTRQGKHHTSAKLPQVPIADANHDLPSLNFTGAAEAEDASRESPELMIQQSKKAKQIEKREAFLQSLSFS